jgi:hypothetical protein
MVYYIICVDIDIGTSVMRRELDFHFRICRLTIHTLESPYLSDSTMSFAELVYQ